MLLELARLLSDDVRALGVFEYITLRAVLACATALLIGLVAGPRVIRKLTEMKIGQAVRSYGPESHLVKTGTPTMGGVLILISIAISTLLWADWTNRFVWVVLLVTFGFGWIGWMDDYRKVYRDPEGMPARQKFFWQATIGLVAAVYLAFAVSAPANADLWPLFKAWVGSGFTMSLPTRADLIVPFFKTVSYPLGVLGFVALTWAVIVGTSNAVNPDRRPGRPGDHAHRDGGQRAGHLRLRGRPRRLFEVPAVSVYPRRFRTDGAVRGDRGAGLAFCGSTRIRRRCSWATWARWRWAARWAPSRSSCARRSCCSSWAASSSSKRCR